VFLIICYLIFFLTIVITGIYLKFDYIFFMSLALLFYHLFFRQISKLNIKIKKKLKNKFITNEDILITRERHRQHLVQCSDYLKNFNEKNESEDFDKAAEDLRLATRHLGMIVGKVDVEEILGSIFNDFCIGK